MTAPEETTLVAETATGSVTTQPQLGNDHRLARGALLGRYVVLDELGAGAMGRVYAAYDPRLDRKIALKLVRLDEVDPKRRQRGRDRLLHEAQTLAKLAHPNVVSVYDVELVDDGVAVAMDFIDGFSLRTWLRERPRDWRQVLQVFIAAGRGLAAAHRAGVVHRDFKPDNVMVEHGVVAEDSIGVSRGARVLVVDFGIARALDSTSYRDEVEMPGAEDVCLTERSHTHGIAGTPAYMSPEQFDNGTVDARSDQFAFCVALWEGFFGGRPFTADSLPTLVHQVMRGQVADPPQDSAVPRWLREVLRQGLAVNPEDRWPDMDALLTALERDPWVRRRRWLAVGGVVVALGAGAWGIIAHAEASPCRGGAELLMGVWDEAVARDIADAFATSKRPYAQASYEAIAPRLDAYAADWVQMHRDNCEATRIRGEQSEPLMDLRTGCLRQRREALRASTDLLRGVDEEIMGNAVQLVANLPPLHPCADIERLTAPMAPPDDPETRREVDRLGARLAEVDASTHAGKYDDALLLARQLAVETEALGYSPLHAEALLRLGYLQEKIGDAQTAEQTLQQAAWLAQRHRHDAVATRAMSELVYVVGNAVGRIDDAIIWAHHADAMAGRLGDPTELARLLHNRGLTHLTAGEAAAGERDLREALALREEALGIDHPDTINSLANMANALDALGEHGAAATAYERGVNEATRVLGPAHPRVAGYQTNLAELLGRMGETERALVHAEQAIVIMRRELVPDHPHLVSALINLGTVHYAREDWAASQAALVEALEIVRRRSGGSPDPNEADILHNLGALAVRQSDAEAAIQHFESALRIWEVTLGPDHPEVVDSLHNLAWVALEHGRVQEAYELAGRGLEIQRSRGRTTELMTGRFHLLLAQIELARDRPRAARPHAEEAVAVLEPRELAGRHLAQARLTLAQASWVDPQSRERALELARSGLADAPSDEADVRESLEQWLAEHDRRP